VSDLILYPSLSDKAETRLAGALFSAVLDQTKSPEGVSDLGAFDRHTAAAMGSVGVAVAPHVRDHAAAQAEVLRAMMVAIDETHRARAAGDQARLKQLDSEVKALKRRGKELTFYKSFTEAAEALHRAATFEEFRAGLPAVDLGRLYGAGTRFNASPFPLVWALSARDRPLERVQMMLAAGARLDLATGTGETVLHAFAAMKRKGAVRGAVLRLLVLRGADIEASDQKGETPLAVALDRGSAEDVAHLLAAGADPNAPMTYNAWVHLLTHAGNVRVSGLMLAAPDPIKVRLLLDHGADPDRAGREGLKLASWLRGQIAWADKRLADARLHGKNVPYWSKRRDDLAASLAMLASHDEHETRGADVPRKLTWAEEPAAFARLEAAATADDLRDALARVDISTWAGAAGTHPIYWPIMAESERPQRLWLMLAAGASVQGSRGNGTALHILAGQRRKDATEQAHLARMLVNAGADLEAVDYVGRTPLAKAVTEGGAAEVAALLALGASVNVPALDGWRGRSTPLLLAAALEPRKLRLLLDHGADPHTPARDGTRLADQLRAGIADWEAKLAAGNMSGNLARTYGRWCRAYAKSLRMIEGAGRRAPL